MKTRIYLIGLVIVSNVFFSFAYYQVKPWDVPEKDKKMRNPVKADTEVLKIGKDLWINHCVACHGRNGAGDGPKSGQMKTFMKDMGSASVQGQTDGALYYKISQGRGEMPAYKEKIPDSKELWSLIHFVRSSFKAK
jgi:mono/diheme cytochrome c family protein